MAPGRFRRRLSDDDPPAPVDGGALGPGAAPAAGAAGSGVVPSPGTPAQVRVSWLGSGAGSTRGRLPWLSPREHRHPLKDMRFTCFRSYLTNGTATSAGGADAPRSPSASPSCARQPSKSPARKSHENVYTVSPPVQPAGPGATDRACLGARLRALSARCLALVHADRNKAHISSSKPSKQRSFSSGALPGLHDFQRSRSPQGAQGAQAPLSTTPPNVGGEEDGDSGILVGSSLPWGASPATSSRASSRAMRSASLDRELLGGSPLLDGDLGESHEDQPASSELGQVRQSRLSTKSSSSSSEISEIFSRFQRRRVAGGGGGGAGGGAGGGSGAGGSRPSSPPLLPAPPQRRLPRPQPRAFHLVRLTRASPCEELGIFIAKSDASAPAPAPAQGYVVAHVVPGGLAHRDGQLRLGDELVVVNGRQLRGLSMAAARQRLRAGPTQVDIVIARPSECTCGSGGAAEGRDSGMDSGLDSGLDTSGDSITDSIGCQACGSARLQDLSPAPRGPRTLQESSVDYENVVLCPRQSSRAAPPSSRSRSASPSPSPSPSRSRSPSPGWSRSPSHSPDRSRSPEPEPRRRPQLFQKHSAYAAGRRSLALVSRAAPHEVPAETQHHSLKRRGRRDPGPGAAVEAGAGAGPGAARLAKVVGSAGTASEFCVQLRKGPGCGALGFTVVGGADSPRGSLPIFVRSVLEGGQAAQDGRLHPGDELVSLNGQPLRGATHTEAVAMFRAVRAGPVLLSVCRRTSKKAQSCSDLVADRTERGAPGDS